MKKLYFGLIILSLTSCKPEQGKTEWSSTAVPASGENMSRETRMDIPLALDYSVKPGESSSSGLELFWVEGPFHGDLRDCVKSILDWKCLYVPNDGFIGDDRIVFRTRDGDFVGEKSVVSIKVRGPENLSITREMIYTAKGNTICDPLGGDDGFVDSTKGLVGNIRLLNDSSNLSIRHRLSGYLDEALSHQVADSTIFMSNVNVPQRSFDEGFSSEEGDTLQVNGETLIEYFNVNLDSIIKIESNSQYPSGAAVIPGEYEIAVISDDGSKLLINESGTVAGQVPYLHADDAQAPRMVCGAQDSEGKPTYLNFAEGKSFKMTLNYFQGQRHGIALQMFWRKKGTGSSYSAHCGSLVYPADLQTKMFDEGWSIIPPSVFNLPEQYDNNACINHIETITELEIQEDIEVKDKDFSVKIDFGNNGSVENYDGSIIVEEVDGADFKYKLKLSDSLDVDQDLKVIIEYQIKNKDA